MMTDYDNNILSFLVEASLILSFLSIIYLLIFRKLTFYKHNRFLLLFIAIISIGLPMIEFDVLTESTQITRVFSPAVKYSDMVNSATAESAVATTPTENVQVNNKNPEVSDQPVNYFRWLLSAYLFIVLVIFGRLVFRLLKIKRLALGGERKVVNGRQVILCSSLQPFSFFGYIFIHKDHLGRNDINVIVSHESIHSKEYHSLDAVCFELLKAVFWFNPLVYVLARQSMLVNEYYTDEQVALDAGLDRYSETLLAIGSGSTGQGYSLQMVNNFAVLSMASRFSELVRLPSPKSSGWFYSAMLPITLVLISLFSCNITESTSADKRIKTVTAYFSDEYGDQQDRNAKKLIDLEYDVDGNLISDIKSIRYKDARFHNRTKAMLSFINWDEDVNILHFGKDWSEISKNRNKHEVEQYVAGHNARNPGTEARVEEILVKGAPFYKIVPEDGKIVEWFGNTHMRTFEFDESGNIAVSHHVLYTTESMAKVLLKAAAKDDNRNNEEYRKLIEKQRQGLKVALGSFEYDDAARLVKFHNTNKSKFNNRIFKYDKAGRLSEITRLDHNNEQVNRYVISYSGEGDIEKVVAYNTDDQPEYTAWYEITYH